MGVFDRIEKELQSQMIEVQGIKELALDSTHIKVHPNGTGAPAAFYGRSTDEKGRNPSAKVAVD